MSVVVALVCLMSAQPTFAQSSTPESMVQQYVQAINQGDVNEVMSSFAPVPEIAYSGFGSCQLWSVCVGADPIRRAMQAQVAQHESLAVTGIETFGSVVVAQMERRNDFISCHGHERVVNTLVAEVTPQGIVSLSDVPDWTDAQTLENGRIVAQNPSPPCVTAD
jgi:hypothetical protein